MPTLSQPLMLPVPIALDRDSEAGLVAASRRGDEQAFGALVRRHQNHVFRLLGRFFRRPEEVEDVAQETFLRAWSKLGTYRAEAPFEHWLTRVALRCSYDRLRQTRTQVVPLVVDLPGPHHDPTARLEVQRLLAGLPAAERMILLLLDGEGWSVAEIATRLGWTRVNVRVRAHRARKKLRRVLEEGLP